MESIFSFFSNMFQEESKEFTLGQWFQIIPAGICGVGSLLYYLFN